MAAEGKTAGTWGEAVSVMYCRGKSESNYETVQRKYFVLWNKYQLSKHIPIIKTAGIDNQTGANIQNKRQEYFKK
jgi:hypothetical protein